MKKIILIICLTIISFAQDCSIESMQSLLKIDIKNLKSIIIDDEILEGIKSSQGSEGKFYYEKDTKELKYSELIIYGEMGKKIIKFYFDKSEKILIKSIDEYYNHHIYEKKNDLKTLSKIVKLFPICNINLETLFYGIDKNEYNDILKLALKLNKLFKKIFNNSQFKEPYVAFNKMKREYITGKLDEKKYLNKWINIPLSDENIDFNISKEEETVIYKTIEEFYPKAFYVGIVQLEKFKINVSIKEKKIEKKVKILKTFKGFSENSMRYNFYTEPSNTYFPEDEMKKHIVFLFKEKNLIYEDAFLSFPMNTTILKMIEKVRNNAKNNN